MAMTSATAQPSGAAACSLCGADSLVVEPGVPDHFFGYPGAWDWRCCTAPDCGLAWLDSPLGDADLAAAYARYYTHDAAPPGAAEVLLGRAVTALAARIGDRFPLLPFLFREAENRLLDGGGIRPRAEGLVVDLGCGQGERLPWFEALGWGAAIGVDPDPVAIERGRAAGRRLQLGTAEQVPLQDGVADVVFLHHVVEHLRDPARGLREARRILRPGGRLVITTPNFEAEGRSRWGAWWRGYEAPRHRQLFSVAAMRRLLREVGLTVETCRTSARAVPFMDREVARAKGDTGRRPALAFWREDRAIRAMQRRIRRGENLGEELFVVARAD